LKRFFDAALQGIQATDFWAACHAVTWERRRFCLANLLLELE